MAKREECHFDSDNFIESTDHRCGGMKSAITGGAVILYT